MSKLSKKQRTEKAATRRFLILGGGAAVGLALAGGIVMSRPPEFPILGGPRSIGERLAATGPDTHHQQLVGSPTSIDILVIGDSSCGFCRRFIEEGLEDLMEFAQSRGLSLGYASIGFTQTGAITTGVAACLEQIPSDLGPSGRVRALYDLGALLMEGGAQGSEIITASAEDLGVRPRRLDACVADEFTVLKQRNAAMQALFEVESTPTFVVRKQSGNRLATFQGFTGSAAVIRQIEVALKA